jgi:hypothetical protein
LLYASFLRDRHTQLAQLGTQLEWEVESSLPSSAPAAFWCPLSLPALVARRDRDRIADEKEWCSPTTVDRGKRQLAIECVELPLSTVSPTCYFEAALATSLLHGFAPRLPPKELTFASVYPEEYVSWLSPTCRTHEYASAFGISS